MQNLSLISMRSVHALVCERVLARSALLSLVNMHVGALHTFALDYLEVYTIGHYMRQ